MQMEKVTTWYPDGNCTRGGSKGWEDILGGQNLFYSWVVNKISLWIQAAVLWIIREFQIGQEMEASGVKRKIR